ncbi:hypothetical protein CDEST_02154 [Colletotrichum destructivum]|uniref:Myb-like domain-containing protein n=1 Tax=Colletotrichum destructivum TaxID=34406 RepID=A0AAX4I1B8_9PEZI|nr:hypothetical protein CDEST_02154 [Colletotrichum destructivum]
MSIDLDKICFYQPPTPGVRQRAPKGIGQQSNSANPSITEEVAVKPTIGSYTHHGDASSSNKSAGLAPEVHRQSVGSVLTPRDTTCSRIGGDTIPIKTPVPMKEPTKLGMTGEGRASETSVTRSLIKAPTPTTSQPITLAEASAGSLSKSCDGYEVEGNTASPQSTGDRAESTPETSLERHSKDAASTSIWEQQTASSSGPQRGSLPAWLECCRSQPIDKGHTQEVSEPVTTVSGMPDSVTRSTEDDPMSPVSSPSVTSSPPESGYEVTTTGMCQAVLGRSTSEKTTAPSAEQLLGNSGESEPEVTAEPYSTRCMSSPAPQEVVSLEHVVHVSLTASPSSAPSTQALRRSRRGRVPAGGYTEVDSDAESDANESVNMSLDEDQPLVTRSSPLGSRGQLGNKRRRACSHEESTRDSSASKKVCGPGGTSTHPSKTKRRSRRIAEHKEIGMVSPPRSEGASQKEQSPIHVFATFDEFPLHLTPLNNFVVKRTIVGHVTTFTIEWQQVTPQCRCQVPSEVARPSSHSPPKPRLVRSPTKPKRRFSYDENKLLRDLKERNLPWKEIHRQFSVVFPGRSVGSLQVHYSTNLKH